MTSERQELLIKFEEERSNFLQQYAKLQRETEQKLLEVNAEKHKQFELLQMEKIALNEKLKLASDEQKNTAAELERTLNEANKHSEQDKQVICQMKADLSKLQVSQCVFYHLCNVFFVMI